MTSRVDESLITRLLATRRYQVALLGGTAGVLLGWLLIGGLGWFGAWENRFFAALAESGVRAPLWQEITLAALAAFGLAWTSVEIGQRSLRLVVVAATLLEIAALSWVFSLYGVVFPPFLALVAGAIGAAVGLIYSESAAGRRRQEIAALFGERIAPHIAEQLCQSPHPLPQAGQRREASVVVCEVFNRDLIRSTLTPEAYVAFFHDLLGEGEGLLLEHGGLLEDRSPESLTALFGIAPQQEGEEHAVAACRAALALNHRLERFCREAGERWDIAPDYRIGVHSGAVTLATYGSRSRFTATGEPMEFCRQLACANTFYGSRILLGPTAFAQAQEEIEVRPMELIRRKRESEPEEIYELLAPKGELPEQEVALTRRFRKGVELFRKQRWEAASAEFRAVLKEGKRSDGPSQFYLDRIQRTRDEEAIVELDWSTARF